MELAMNDLGQQFLFANIAFSAVPAEPSSSTLPAPSPLPPT
jgi:hypothetical protein